MARVLFIVLLLLFCSAIVLEPETRSTETTDHESPCTLHPVNGRICVSEKILYGFRVRRVAPKVPDKANATGEVVLHLIVAKNGKPERVSLISGDPALGRSAVRAVKQWLFKPYIYNGEYVEMESDIHIRFPDPNQQAMDSFIGETVRRGNALDFSGNERPARELRSLHRVAARRYRFPRRFLLGGTCDRVLTVFINYRLPSVLVVVAGSCIEIFRLRATSPNA
jgi:TonB family protein